MARSSSVDAIEKFRFSVYILNLSLDPASVAQDFIGFLRGGFSEVSLPKQTTTVMEYRENIDSAHVQMLPGMTKYEPVTLKRGVTTNSDFYRWANQVHNPNQIIASAIQRISGKPEDSPPSDSLNFRRDIVIVSHTRSGAVGKAWMLRDAWVSSYTPGDMLGGLEDGAKLMEEMTLTYESFQELTVEGIVSAGLDSLLGII